MGSWAFQVDAAQRHRESRAAYLSSSWPYVSDANSEQLQLTPRLSFEDRIGVAELKAVTGLDWQDWDYDPPAP